jgi:hypothetical protein
MDPDEDTAHQDTAHHQDGGGAAAGADAAQLQAKREGEEHVAKLAAEELMEKMSTMSTLEVSTVYGV